MYKIDFSVMLPDTDAAGILFFGNYYKLAHQAYEIFMENIEYSLAYILNEADILLLIVHSECDYKRSLNLGDRFTVELNVEKTGKTSFSLFYRFFTPDKQLIAELKTIHVAIDKIKKRPVKLPDRLKKELEIHLL